MLFNKQLPGAQKKCLLFQWCHATSWSATSLKLLQFHSSMERCLLSCTHARAPNTQRLPRIIFLTGNWIRTNRDPNNQCHVAMLHWLQLQERNPKFSLLQACNLICAAFDQCLLLGSFTLSCFAQMLQKMHVGILCNAETLL